MKNAVMLPNDVMSDGSRDESESPRSNVHSISNKKRPSREWKSLFPETDVGANIQCFRQGRALASEDFKDDTPFN